MRKWNLNAILIHFFKIRVRQRLRGGVPTIVGRRAHPTVSGGAAQEPENGQSGGEPFMGQPL